MHVGSDFHPLTNKRMEVDAETEVPANIDDKNIYQIDLDDTSVQGFDLQRKIASVPSEKPHLMIVAGIVVIILLLVILIGICGATVHRVYNTPAASSSTGCSTGTASTSSLSNNNAQFDQLARAIQNVSDLINSQLMYAVNNSDAIGQLTDSTMQNLIGIVRALSSIERGGAATSGAIDNILLVVNQILATQNASQLFNTFQHLSCDDILKNMPDSPSGYYLLNGQTVYCNMDNLCNAGGGWTRLAYLDMASAAFNCPSGFKLYQSGSVRACGRPGNSGSCVSQTFQPNGISYSQVCGKVTGYQYATSDAFHGGGNINSPYVEGVSITYGSPRTHVWTFAAGARQNYNQGNYAYYNCPCSTGSLQTVPSFVGSNYYCESGNPNQGIGGVLYTADPLWDGQGCGSLEQACCTVPGMPWFYRNFSTAITDFLELRVCSDQSPGNEDSPVGYYEIYVK